MDQIPVVSERQLDGAEKLIRGLVARGFPLVGACWARTPRYAKGYLYLVAPTVEKLDPGPGYREVRATLADLDARGAWGHRLETIDPFDVMLVGPGTDIGRAMQWEYDHYVGPGPTLKYGWLGGDIALEGAGYVYPPELFRPVAPAPAAAG